MESMRRMGCYLHDCEAKDLSKGAEVVESQLLDQPGRA